MSAYSGKLNQVRMWKKEFPSYYLFVSISLLFKMINTLIQNAKVASRKKFMPGVNRNGGCSQNK
jgi:hypothetical protein